MKLIGELKEKVEAVESDMEKKAIIAHAGMLLTDDELTEVCGGADAWIGNTEKTGGPQTFKNVTIENEETCEISNFREI